MKLIGTLIIVTFAVACGNPHISSVKSGIERSNPPLAQEACTKTEVEVNDYRFFMGTNAPEDYKRFVKCKKMTREDFNTHADGTVQEISNQGQVDLPYTLTHRSETQHGHDKVITIEEIFGQDIYQFMLKNHAAYSGSVDSLSKDAFVWKFASPISFWSAKPVRLEDHATLRIFNCSEELLDEAEITDHPEFIGVISAFENICYISLSAAGGSDTVTIDDFEYGTDH